MKKNFKFEIVTPDKVYTSAEGSYAVQLPHSCDKWVIASDDDKEKVIAGLEQFIKEAREALKELKKGSKR